MKHTDKSNSIDSKKFYTLYEMVKLNVFPWIKPATYERYKGIVVTDMMTNKILKATKTQGARGLQYQIRGSNIINYLSAKESGSI